MGMLPYFDPTHWLDFRTDFLVENQGTSDWALHVNCSRISELDVSFSITQIRPLQPKLWSISQDCHSWVVYLLCLDFWTDFNADFVLISWTVLVVC